MFPRKIIPLFFLSVTLAVVTGCSETGVDSAKAASEQSANQSSNHKAEKQGSDSHGDAEHAGGHSKHEGEASPDRIHLKPAQRKRLDIEVGEAGSGSATAMISAPATVAFDSDRIARIGPRLSAKVVEVTKDLGARVETGDTVAILDSVALGKAKATYLTASARYRTRLAAYRRNQRLAKDKIISDAQLQESRAKYRQARAEREAARSELRLYGLSKQAIGHIGSSDGAPLSQYPLTTPRAGVIQQRDVVPGQSLSANETPIHVVDNREMWVMIEADEQSLSRLQPGLEMQLRVRPLPKQTFTGEVNWISAELDKQSRTVRVRATVANPDGLLKTGMFGTARIQTQAERQFALVPVDAVQSVGERDIVFVPGDEPGAFRATPVVLGAEGGGQVEVKQGLNPGDAVVVDGSFDLSSVLTAGGRSAAHSH